MLYNSGHFLQQFGLYDECLSDNLTYTLSLIYKGVNGTNGAYTGLYMGLCLPESCNADNHSLITNTLNLVLKGMSSISPDLYVGNVVDDPYGM